MTDHGKAATQVNTVKSRIKVFIQHCLLHAAQTHLSRAVLCFHVLENIFRSGDTTLVVYEGQTQRKRCSLFWWRCRISTTKPERCMLTSRPPPPSEPLCPKTTTPARQEPPALHLLLSCVIASTVGPPPPPPPFLLFTLQSHSIDYCFIIAEGQPADILSLF